MRKMTTPLYLHEIDEAVHMQTEIVQVTNTGLHAWAVPFFQRSFDYGMN